MPSAFDSLVQEQLAPLIVETFGELGPNGERLTVTYREPVSPDGSEPRQWPYISSPRRFQDQIDENGGIARRETMTVTVPTSEVTASGITRFQSRAELTVDGVVWAIDESTSVWDPSFVTFGLKRDPLVRMNEGRNAAV